MTSAAPHDGLRQTRRREARKQLIRTSTALFREEGFAETTLGAIAAAAGMTVPTLLTHFPSKEHLALCWEFDVLADFAQEVAAAGPDVPTMQLWRSLNESVLSRDQVTLDAFAKRWVWIAATPSLHRAVLLLAQDHADVLEGSFRADFGSRIRQTSFRVRARAMATSLAFTNFAMLIQWGHDGAPDDLRERIDEITRSVQYLADTPEEGI